jgi:hypothetical protein
LLNLLQSLAMAARCLCHVIWQKHVPLKLSNI